MIKRDMVFFFGFLVLCTFLFIPEKGFSIYFGQGKIKPAQLEFVPGRLIIKLKPEVDKKVVLTEVRGIIKTGVREFDELNIRFSVINQEKLFKEFKKTALKSDKLSSIYILDVPQGTDLKQMKTEYESLPEVEYTELDYKVELFDTPNDTLFENQWYLNNTGQGYLGVNRIPGNYNDTQIIKYGTEDADIDALEAFQRDQETTIPLVGIIDTGVDLDHEDILGNIWINPGEIPDDSIDNDHNGFVDDFYGWDFSGDSSSLPSNIIGDSDPTDYFGHGTHCAGIVAAVRDNAIGVSGINSPCKIMAIKFFPNSFFSLGAKSIIYAADMGCDVVNMSWGSPFPSKVIEDALDYAIDKGVLPIAAAGNSGSEDDFYPASLPRVFTVGASNSDDEVTYFSTYGDHIEVVAPGEDILSLRADLTDMYADGGASGIEPDVHIVNEKYYLCDGTSMASPCVVGVAAYILAASPGISNQRVIEIIEQSADDILYPYGGDTLHSPGKDIYSGYGRVNLNSSLELLSGRLAKIDYPYENAIVSGDVVILGTASGDSFHNYVLEYGEGYSPQSWIQIENSDVPVSKDTLGIWNSSTLTGLYSLRLTVGDQNQSIVHVIASNETLVRITSPCQYDTVQEYVEFYGYTIASDFSGYTLEYGYGASPSIWDTIITSTMMVADDVLGNWVPGLMEQGDYTVRLIVETNSSEVFADTVLITVKGIASVDWTQELHYYGSLSPAVGDIDGDGFDEIVVGVGRNESQDTTGGIHVFNHEGEPEEGWPKDTSTMMMCSPALGDLDGDGVDDIVICSEYGIHSYLSNSPAWFESATTLANITWADFSSPVITDLEGDGDLEVLIMNRFGSVYAWRNNGESVIPGNYGIFAEVCTSWCSEDYPCIAVSDLDKDGEKEVIVGSAAALCYPGHPAIVEGGIYIFSIDGDLLLGPGDYPDKYGWIFGITIANVDGNDDLEIIVFGADSSHFSCSALKKDGTQVANFPIILEDMTACWWFGNHPAVGDLEGDGILEIVVSAWTVGEARIYAWHQDGTPLGVVGSQGLLVSMKSPDAERKKEVLSSLGDNIGDITAKIKGMSREEFTSLISPLDQDPIFASVPETFGSPVLADVNADGNVDIIARAGYCLGSGYERVFAWDYEGKLIPGYPLYAAEEPSMANYFPHSPVMADIDKDGMLNLVLCTDDHWPGCKLISWELDTDYSTIYTDWPRYWPKYMHDKWNSGTYAFDPEEEKWTVSNVVLLINYLFGSGPAPNSLHSYDVNCDGDINITDVVYLINYLFKGGPPPC